MFPGLKPTLISLWLRIHIPDIPAQLPLDIWGQFDSGHFCGQPLRSSANETAAVVGQDLREAPLTRSVGLTTMSRLQKREGMNSRRSLLPRK